MSSSLHGLSEEPCQETSFLDSTEKWTRHHGHLSILKTSERFSINSTTQKKVLVERRWKHVVNNDFPTEKIKVSSKNISGKFWTYVKTWKLLYKYFRKNRKNVCTIWSSTQVPVNHPKQETKLTRHTNFLNDAMGTQLMNMVHLEYLSPSD